MNISAIFYAGKSAEKNCLQKQRLTDADQMFRLNTVWSFKYINQVNISAGNSICSAEKSAENLQSGDWGELTLTKCSASTAAAQIPFDSLWKYFVRGQLHPCPKETAVGKKLHIWRSDSICVKSTFKITTLKECYIWTIQSILFISCRCLNQTFQVA